MYKKTMKLSLAMLTMIALAPAAWAQDVATAKVDVQNEEAPVVVKAEPAVAAKAVVAASDTAGKYVKDATDLAGAAKFLEKADANHNPFTDQTIRTRMTLNGGIHNGNMYLFDTYTKGENRRAVRFSEPPEMRGMGGVIKGRNEVYARLPDSEKVRRVGTHSKRQSFYGSDWSMDDMSMIYLGKDYNVKKIVNLKSDGGKTLTLELQLKEGVDLPYPKLVIKLDRELALINYIEYYADNMKFKKKQERFDLKEVGGGYPIYSRVVLTDIDSKHTTQNEVLEEKINQNIPDDNFSKRWLVRSL